MKYVLFNPSSTSHLDEKSTKAKLGISDGEATYIDPYTIENKEEFFSNLAEGDEIILCGGDGTLNNFANYYDFTDYPHPIYFYPCGNGNDFLRDLGKNETTEIVQINQYLNHLPVVEVAGVKKRYINGIGFGIDGLVCVVADQMKAEGKTDIDYTKLSIKLLLGQYKRTNATVEVDGKEYKFSNVWLASAMNGRYYGGGMKVAPDQDRLSDVLTICVWHDLSKLPALMMFPKIFEGKHVLNKKKVTILTGHHIKVVFEKPTGLQIDGESYADVSFYEASK